MPRKPGVSRRHKNGTGVNKHKSRTRVRLTIPQVNQEPLDPPIIPESSPKVASLSPRATAVPQTTSLPRSLLPLKVKQCTCCPGEATHTRYNR